MSAGMRLGEKRDESYYPTPALESCALVEVLGEPNNETTGELMTPARPCRRDLVPGPGFQAEAAPHHSALGLIDSSRYLGQCIESRPGVWHDGFQGLPNSLGSRVSALAWLGTFRVSLTYPGQVGVIVSNVESS